MTTKPETTVVGISLPAREESLERVRAGMQELLKNFGEAELTLEQIGDEHHLRVAFADYRDAVRFTMFLEQLVGSKATFSVVQDGAERAN